LSRRRGRKLLNPESREALNQWQVKWLQEEQGTKATDRRDLPAEVAHQLNIPYNLDGNGEMTAKEAGKIGGVIGGQTVKKLIETSLLSFTRNVKKD
jgi:hypothetical protein